MFIGKYNYSSREKVNIFFIVCYICLTYFSLFLYIIYSHIVKRDKVNYKGKKLVSSMKLFGYIVYSENTPSEKICCCDSCYNCCELFEDIINCCKTIGCFKTIFCCQCSECDENSKVRIRNNEDVNKIERIFIFYKINGRCNWCAKIMTDIKVYPLALVLYLVHLTNMGFEEVIWNNHEKNDNEDEYIINIIILCSIFFFI